MVSGTNVMDVGGRVGPTKRVAGSGRTKMQSSLPYRHHEERSRAGRESARRVCSTLEECPQGVDDCVARTTRCSRRAPGRSRALECEARGRHKLIAKRSFRCSREQKRVRARLAQCRDAADRHESEVVHGGMLSSAAATSRTRPEKLQTMTTGTISGTIGLISETPAAVKVSA